ncbi:histidine kinase [Tamlana sp. 2201CG12-4]|uniref:sensor histidine kinase n=1 Tax=Tamlana sp. 2201CG12-4 TaxID=3112582 RepID=UPI002DBB8F39|nr:histidine kinase [Tamlana sp. 2201CG12-4]MEC3906791.1 histidine kinase [Tamlana sp. 2201CG12-4]
MEFKKTKPSILLGIALLISFLINLPRILKLYEVVERLSDTFPDVSVKDILLRMLILFVYSWGLLQINTNWKLLYSRISIWSKSVIRLLANLLVYFSIVSLFVYVREQLTGEVMSDFDSSILYIVYGVVLLIIVFISRIIRFQMAHQVNLAEKELLKQQSLRNELEALKNQINPHFLFNSLNSLNSLIRDNKQATTFVNKLSFMYRYILQSGSEDLVSLKEELQFLESYVYLIKTRYRDRFKIEINIEDDLLNEKLPTLALQLLVENAVKHSEISETNPLLVKVYSKDSYVIVENVIRPRTTFVDSTGNGLINLDKRYQILVKKSIVISDTDQVFKVKLPLK